MTTEKTPLPGYYSPGKKAVGKAWQAFLANHLINRFACLALCLPSDVNEDARRFRKSGFRMQNIWGVERFGGVCMSQAELDSGIRIFNGDLGEFSPWFLEYHQGQFFDACSVDISGMIHTYGEDIRSLFPIFIPGDPNQAKVMMVNSFASRDAHALAEGNTAISFFRAAVGGHPTITETLERLRFEHGYTCSHHPSDVRHEVYWAREFGLLWWLLYTIGTFNHSANGLVLDNEFCDQLDGLMNSVRRVVEEHIPVRGRYGTDLSRIRPHFVNDFRIKNLFERKQVLFWPEQIMRFVYISAKSPRIRTWFIRFGRASNPEEARSLYDVALDVCRIVHQTEIIFFDRNGNKITLQGAEEGGE